MPKHTTPRKPSSGKYTGTLAEPIYLASGLARHLDPKGVLEKIERERAIRQLIAKFPELFKCYKIDVGSKNSWMRLAVALAREHVAGMRIHPTLKPTRGREAKWVPDQEEELLRKVETLRLEKGLTIARAVEELRQTKEFRSFFVGMARLVAGGPFLASTDGRPSSSVDGPLVDWFGWGATHVANERTATQRPVLWRDGRLLALDPMPELLVTHLNFTDDIDIRPSGLEHEQIPHLNCWLENDAGDV